MLDEEYYERELENENFLARSLWKLINDSAILLIKDIKFYPLEKEEKEFLTEELTEYYIFLKDTEESAYFDIIVSTIFAIVLLDYLYYKFYDLYFIDRSNLDKNDIKERELLIQRRIYDEFCRRVQFAVEKITKTNNEVFEKFFREKQQKQEVFE